MAIQSRAVRLHTSPSTSNIRAFIGACLNEALYMVDMDHHTSAHSKAVSISQFSIAIISERV